MIIYLVENLQNKKKYVGVTKTTLQRRFREHISKSKIGSDCPLHRAIRKYGKDTFSTMILEEFSDYGEALAAEIKWIERLDTYNSGYNATIGGEGTLGIVPSEEKRQKLSEAAKKWWATASPEQKENHKQKAIQTLSKYRNLSRKPATAETKAKMSKTRIGKLLGPLSEETKQKISKANKGKLRGSDNPMMKPENKEKQKLACVGRRKTVRDDGSWGWR